MKNNFILISLLSSLYACSDSGSTSAPTGPETGVFLDSPVINVGYRTETQSGVTNLLGEYNYIPGETVTFFIGDLEFTPTPATGIITPLDLAGTQDTSNSTVVNMIRLLQTLDKNGIPDDGIEITEMAKLNATQVNFSLDEESFALSTAVDTLIMNGGQDTPVAGLVSAAAAIEHFESTLASISAAVTVSGNFSITETVTQDDREWVNGVGFTLFCGGDNWIYIDGGPSIAGYDSEVGQIYPSTYNMEFNVESNKFTTYWNDDGSASTGSYNPSTGALSWSVGPYLDGTTPENFSFEYTESLIGTFNSEAKTFIATYTEITTGTYTPTGNTVECTYAATFEGRL